MKWNSSQKTNYLSQLHEESRYTRRFHHTIFSVSMTIYAGLAFLQTKLVIDNTNTAIYLSDLAYVTIKWIVPFLFLLIIPGILIFMFVNWHFVQGGIRDNICALQKELGFPTKYIRDEKYEGFTNKRFWQRFCTGKGHITFIVLLLLITLLNLVMFLILSGGITKG
jgi:hypothetical protein